ncbi:MAG: electron transfer flavoprotein beta subunit/FixA family protein [Flavobacteriales bacterium]|nr:electron transfer flavoprotein beta subunit/FixA family protein [Flavobacteriales bacterium]
MKILVPISKVPDTTSKISFTDGDSKFNEEGIQWIVNPYDEWYALVRALEITEAGGGSVTVISVGDATAEPVIRKALALGAHEAVRVDATATESYQVAKEIAAYAADKGFDMVLLGKETINYNGSEVGGMLAEFMGLPYISLASKLEVSGDTATLDRSIEGGVEVVEVKMPFVASASKGMAEQRIPNMRGIMAARTKPLTVVAASGADAKTAYVKYSLPAPKSAVKLVNPENMDELVRLLHEEAKVI